MTTATSPPHPTDLQIPRYDYEVWCGMTWPDIYRARLDAGRVVELERIWTGGVSWQDVAG